MKFEKAQLDAKELRMTVLIARSMHDVPPRYIVPVPYQKSSFQPLERMASPEPGRLGPLALSSSNTR